MKMDGYRLKKRKKKKIEEEEEEKEKNRHRKCRSRNVRGVHTALIVGSPSFVKASVLCRLHAFVGSKSAGVHTASPVSAKLALSFFITRSGRNFAHERSV